MRRIAALALALPAALVLAACARNEPPAPPPAAEAPAAQQPTAPAKAEPATDLEQLAERLVAQSAGIREGEIVLVTGGPRDLELVENIATHVRRAGAFPLVTYSSDRMTLRSYQDVPAEFDKQRPKLNLELARLVDAAIFVQPSYAQGLLAGIPAERRAARDKAEVAVNEAFLKNVRVVEVGNGMYPTDWQAERFGMKESELTRLFWTGVNVDYGALQSRAEAVKAAFAGARKLHLTTPAGTDLTMDIGGRQTFTSDGLISDDDRKKGGPSAWVFLPAGEVMTTPRRGSASGKLVVERLYYDGEPVDDLQLQFERGKVVAMTGSGAGFEFLQRSYDAVDEEGKAELAFFDLGVNEALKLPAEAKVGAWVPAGMVTVGLGHNIPFGGDNAASFSLAAHLRNATVTLDGKTIVENGALKL